MLWKEGEQSGSCTGTAQMQEDTRMQQKNKTDELGPRGGGREVGQPAETKTFAGWVSVYLHLRRDFLAPFKLMSVDRFLTSV